MAVPAISLLLHLLFLHFSPSYKSASATSRLRLQLHRLFLLLIALDLFSPDPSDRTRREAHSGGEMALRNCRHFIRLISVSVVSESEGSVTEIPKLDRRRLALEPDQCVHNLQRLE
jgi:hypothetical protein